MTDIFTLTTGAHALGMPRATFFVWLVRGWCRGAKIAGRILVTRSALEECRASARYAAYRTRRQEAA